MFFNDFVLESNRKEKNMKQPRFFSYETEPLPREVLYLQREITKLSRDDRNRLETLCEEVVEMFRRRRRVMEMAHEALAQLRLEVRFLNFDLEATRDEKQTLKEQLDDMSPS